MKKITLLSGKQLVGKVEFEMPDSIVFTTKEETRTIPKFLIKKIV